MGSVNLDNTGSGSAITLSSDGTSLLLDGTAIGGGGAALELYAENPSTPTTPVATGTNAVAIGSGAVASGTYAQSFGRTATATAIYATAIGTNTDATSNYSTALGQNSASSGSQAVSGLAAMALGGSYASGADSFAAAIANNTSSYGATGANSVAIGRTNRSTQSYATTLGGYLAEATATYSTVVGGRQNTADATYSVASGYGAEVRGIIGKVVHSPIIWISSGDTQTGTLVLTAETTNATPKAATSNGASAGTTNQVILPNNSAYAFSGTIIARQQASGSDYASWEIKGALLRDGTAVSTVLGNGIIDKLFATAGAAAWAVALTADTTNGGLAVTVTGAAATNIRWVATVNTSEVTYA